jgi:2-dehydro-3-deoxy-D-arabinonate dehydratase
MKLYRTTTGIVAEHENAFYRIQETWDALIERDNLLAHLRSALSTAKPEAGFSLASQTLLAPIVSQEVWAAGVTYYRSRDARMEESEDAGGGSFYDRVYSADRPELFFKSLAHRVSAPGAPVRIRADSKWNVPEPEMTLVIAPSGKIIGYTIGNDMSSRDIEGENPLYLPQAKVYDGCCALGPGLLISDAPLPASTTIAMRIWRGQSLGFEASTTLESLKRTPEELVGYLYRESSFPHGCFLLTGTGIVPPSSFTLEPVDRIEITIEPIGTLVNHVQ